MGYLRFFYTERIFYRLVPYHMHLKNYIKSFKFPFIKNQNKMRGDSVNNKSARAKNWRGGGVRPPNHQG